MIANRFLVLDDEFLDARLVVRLVLAEVDVHRADDEFEQPACIDTMNGMRASRRASLLVDESGGSTTWEVRLLNRILRVSHRKPIRWWCPAVPASRRSQ